MSAALASLAAARIELLDALASMTLAYARAESALYHVASVADACPESDAVRALQLDVRCLVPTLTGTMKLASQASEHALTALRSVAEPAQPPAPPEAT